MGLYPLEDILIKEALVGTKKPPLAMSGQLEAD